MIYNSILNKNEIILNSIIDIILQMIERIIYKKNIIIKVKL